MSETSSFEQFKETFDAYFSKWWKVAGILFLLVYLLAFGLYTIAILNKNLGHSPSVVSPCDSHF